MNEASATAENLIDGIDVPLTATRDELAELCLDWNVTYPHTKRAGCPYDSGVNLWGPTLNIDRVRRRRYFLDLRARGSLA